MRARVEEESRESAPVEPEAQGEGRCLLSGEATQRGSTRLHSTSTRVEDD